MINIYVGNLPYGTSESDLETLFAQYGEVAKTAIIMDRETGRSRGFGFVEMPDKDSGNKAIEALNGQDYNGRSLTINEARPRQAHGGHGGGGYSQRGGGDTGYSGGDYTSSGYSNRYNDK